VAAYEKKSAQATAQTSNLHLHSRRHAPSRPPLRRPPLNPLCTQFRDHEQREATASLQRARVEIRVLTQGLRDADAVHDVWHDMPGTPTRPKAPAARPAAKKTPVAKRGTPARR
jgi:hypothetical protein